MRVLLHVATMTVGGAERVVIELATALSGGDDTVAIAADTGDLDPIVQELGVARFVVPGYGRSLTSSARAVVQLRNALRSFDPDVVHCHNVKATGLMAVARTSIRKRPPLAATFHGVQRSEYRRAALILRRANCVVCVSDDLADQIADSGLRPDRTRVIRNAVSIPEPSSMRVRGSVDREFGLGEAPVISLVGRLVPQKAPQRFLAAAASISAELSGCNFLIVGDGPMRRQLEDEARALRIEDAVRFTGIREDARALIERSDVIVFSSDWEGMSIVALEALAAGTPVVATNVEGMRELLGGGCGVLTERDPQALAEAVIDLLRDPARQARIGAIGRRKVATEFSLERMVRSYRELYRALASAGPPT